MCNKLDDFHSGECDSRGKGENKMQMWFMCLGAELWTQLMNWKLKKKKESRAPHNHEMNPIILYVRQLVASTSETATTTGKKVVWISFVVTCCHLALCFKEKKWLNGWFIITIQPNHNETEKQKTNLRIKVSKSTLKWCKIHLLLFMCQRRAACTQTKWVKWVKNTSRESKLIKKRERNTYE